MAPRKVRDPDETNDSTLTGLQHARGGTGRFNLLFFLVWLSADLAIDRASRIWFWIGGFRPGTAEPGGILIGKPRAMVDTLTCSISLAVLAWESKAAPPPLPRRFLGLPGGGNPDMRPSCCWRLGFPAPWMAGGRARLLFITLQSRGSEMPCTDGMEMVLGDGRGKAWAGRSAPEGWRGRSKVGLSGGGT